MTELSNIVKVSKFFWGAITTSRPLKVGHVDRKYIPLPDGDRSHALTFKVSVVGVDKLVIYRNDQTYLGENITRLTGNEINDRVITPPRHHITKIVHFVTGYSREYIYRADGK